MVACAAALLIIAAPTAASSCDDLEALGQALAGSRDSEPAQAVARGEAALIDAEESQPECSNGRAMLLGGVASNLHILGRLDESVQRYQQAPEKPNF